MTLVQRKQRIKRLFWLAKLSVSYQTPWKLDEEYLDHCKDLADVARPAG